MLEQYQSGATLNSAFNVHSVTKSITSALVGLSLQKGVLQSEKALVMPFFPQYSKETKDKDAKKKISIGHLLSMQAGFTGADGPQSVAQTLLKEKVAEQSIGTKFKYFTASYMLLSAILTQVNGIPTKDFAQKELFNPLGIHCGFWRKVEGYYCGGDESYFTARDLGIRKVLGTEHRELVMQFLTESTLMVFLWKIQLACPTGAKGKLRSNRDGGRGSLFVGFSIIAEIPLFHHVNMPILKN